GCTLFYLLTGQPPFPGGTLTEKLLHHQQAEPPEVQKFRRDLPPPLSAVVRKMLAKQPADRYQSPAEVIAALDRLLPTSAGLSAGTGLTPWANRWERFSRHSHWLRQLPYLRRRHLLIGAICVLCLAVMSALWLRPSPIGWTTLDSQELRSASGATLTKLADRS